MNAPKGAATKDVSGGGVDYLATAEAFCNLVARARTAKFPGHWSGSAFRHHPCGVIEGLMKLTNEWHVDDYCSIAITDGEGWSRDYCTDSFSRCGNPCPQPINGSEVVVWRNGRWVNDRFRQALEPKARDLLGRMEAHVAAVIAAKAEAQEQAKRAEAAERARIAEAAIAKATGAALSEQQS